MIEVIVLGAGAGGGFPQWNSNAPACRRARAGEATARPRTQCGIAVSGDGKAWFLLNASPDLRIQIGRTPRLHPTGPLRSTPVAGVVLTGGEVDCVAGLLSLRERQPFVLLAHEQVLGQLDRNPIFDVVARDLVPRIALALDRPTPLDTVDGRTGGLTLTGFAVPGKPPLYDEDAASTDGETIGLCITDGASRLLFVPGCAAITPALRQRLDGADCLLFDGTLWRDDEMIDAGLGAKTGQRMGHVSVSGPDGVLEQLRGLSIGTRILIHLNNSNPVLLADSPQRASVQEQGWVVAEDGMILRL